MKQFRRPRQVSVAVEGGHEWEEYQLAIDWMNRLESSQVPLQQQTDIIRCFQAIERDAAHYAFLNEGRTEVGVLLNGDHLLPLIV